MNTIMVEPGYALTRLILVSAVLLVLKFAVAGLYPFAAGLALTLLAYAYLIWWDSQSTEEQLLSPPR